MVMTILFALLVSIPAGGVVAVLLAEWAGADSTYILVFMAIPPGALLACAVYLFAVSRRNAVMRAMTIMLGVLTLTIAVFATIESSTAGPQSNGMKPIVSFGLTLAAIIAAQAPIFRLRERRRTA